jgi:NADPH-dependent 2,4-dienoyl-CoA reductase/sulfur reductase-like enzyme
MAMGTEPVGPSRRSTQQFFVTKPRELSLEEIEQLVEKFADAALRAKGCGVDMVEIHGAHGYLVCQFISPLFNVRTDKYGRDKLLFAIEIVQRIKEKCGADFPVAFRMSAEEFVPGGITLDYAKEIATRLEAAGVDLLNVSGTNPDTEDYCEPNMYVEDEEDGEYYRLIRLGSEIKKVVNIPVVSGGLLSDPLAAEKLLEKKALDMVWLGRQLIADPEWPNKVRTGRLEDIRPCTLCNDGCIGRVFLNKTVWCTVNTLSGFEYRWLNEEALPKAVKSKKVLIVGAGPAGLEAGRICAIRGHRVAIVEKADRIGGTVNIASIPSFKKRWRKLIVWYDTQLRKLGVELQLNTQATLDLIKEKEPDAVVWAAGSEPVTPDIPGVAKAVSVEDVLLGRKKTGQNVVIIGGGLEGLDTALYLAKQGKKVAVVEALPEVGMDMETTVRMSFFRKPGGLIDKYGINIMTNSPVVEVHGNGVEIIDKSGCRKSIEGETVIYAVGRRSVCNTELLENFVKAYVIGDARAPGKIIDAIHEGFMTALDV